MNACRGCGKAEDEHCPKCRACSENHVCQARRNEPWHIIHASSGVAVIGDRG